MLEVAGLAMLRWQALIVATCVLGLPVLFAVYLRESGVWRSLPIRKLVLATVIALGLGVGWALIAGPMVADAYNASLGGQMNFAQVLLCGVAVPVSFALVLEAPVAAVWALDRSGGEALDGFTIGALGALVANAASTATLLAPQVAMGPTAGNQSFGNLFGEAIVQGVAWPVGSVATGGIFGLALWFKPAQRASRGYRRSFIAPAALLGVMVFSIAMGLVDIAPVSTGVYIALEALIALLAVSALRVVIADALLHEAADGTGDGKQLLCEECGQIVTWVTFCSACGIAIRAGSKASRAVRRVESAGSHEAVVSDGKSDTASVRNAKTLSVLGPMTVGVGAAGAAVVAVAMLIQPTPPKVVCPPDCGNPPLGTPIENNPRFSGDGGAFSVAYPGEGSAYEVTLDPPGINGVQLKYVGGDTGTLTLFGEPAQDHSPKWIVEQLITTKYPGANIDYEIPNASVGYQPGYGLVADVYPRDASSTYTRLRVIVVAAVKHNYALIAAASGPYHEFSPEYGTGHPSGANLELAMDMGKYVNSFRWRGDRYGGD
jgi:hypothetical protein